MEQKSVKAIHDTVVDTVHDREIQCGRQRVLSLVWSPSGTEAPVTLIAYYLVTPLTLPDGMVAMTSA